MVPKPRCRDPDSAFPVAGKPPFLFLLLGCSMDRSAPPSTIYSCSATAAPVSTSSIELEFEDQDQEEHIREIEELHNYLDKVKEMVLRPGCPPLMLKVALDSLSSLSKTLASMSANPKLLLSSL